MSIDPKGPWIISNEGKIIYDTGGYGMLGYAAADTFSTEARVATQQLVLGQTTPMTVLVTQQYGLWHVILGIGQHPRTIAVGALIILGIFTSSSSI